MNVKSEKCRVCLRTFARDKMRLLAPGGHWMKDNGWFCRRCIARNLLRFSGWVEVK